MRVRSEVLGGQSCGLLCISIWCFLFYGGCLYKFIKIRYRFLNKAVYHLTAYGIQYATLSIILNRMLIKNCILPWNWQCYLTHFVLFLAWICYNLNWVFTRRSLVGFFYFPPFCIQRIAILFQLRKVILY